MIFEIAFVLIVLETPLVALALSEWLPTPPRKYHYDYYDNGTLIEQE